MCGIAGYYLINRQESSPHLAFAMTRAMAHRGPDDEGITLIAPSQESLDLSTEHTAGAPYPLAKLERAEGFAHHLAMGHRRFSIVDLSKAGHQPFWTDDRRLCLTFNGEIYNYVEVRERLEQLGWTFKTNSDTEVLALAYLQWGVDCFSELVGFWAVALYDTRSGAVLLARDRIGKAPLYVYSGNGGVWWSSEIRPLLQSQPPDTFHVRSDSVAYFVQYGIRDAHDATFYQEISTFPRGSYAWIGQDGSMDPIAYWRLPEHRLSERDLSVQEATSELKSRLFDAVRIRMRADVPVGFELSGGLDSSALVAMASQVPGATMHAFTVSYPGYDGDEEVYARRVVDHFGKRIHYSIIEPEETDFFDHADHYVGLMGEPFHSPNIYSNFRIQQAMARDGIRVSLNGAAGDEVFAGYAGDYYYSYLNHLARTLQIPQLAQELVHFSEGGKSPLQVAARSARVVRSLVMPRKLRPPLPFFYRAPLRLPQGVVSPQPTISHDIQQKMIELMGPWRMNYWLRASNQSFMGVPIEVRAPFLDHRIVDFAFQLPLGYLIRDGWFKWILRQAVNDSLPQEITWRKVKSGFPFPLRSWLQTSRSRFFSVIEPIDCPFVDLATLKASYVQLAEHQPLYLWRLMALLMWWKRCVLGERLA